MSREKRAEDVQSGDEVLADGYFRRVKVNSADRPYYAERERRVLLFDDGSRRSYDYGQKVAVRLVVRSGEEETPDA